MTNTRTLTALSLAAAAMLGATGCGVQGTASGNGRPLATESCGLVRDAARILVSDNGSRKSDDVLDRSVNKAVKTAHRASKANPDYSGVYDAAKVTRNAVKSGDSRELTKAIRVTLTECTKALGTSFKAR